MALRLGSRSRLKALANDPSAPVPARAEALAAGGDLRSAITLLEDANRREPDAELERLLVRLRFEAFERRGRVRHRPSWPPEVPDLFPDTVVGPPEITRDELTAEVVLSGILHHGSLLVRGLIDEARVDQLVGDIQRAFSVHDTWEPGGTPPPIGPWFSPIDELGDDRPFLRAGGGVAAAEAPRAFFHVTEMFEELGMRELATSYFGEDPLLLANKWTLRRVAADAGDADWHQDGSFMGDVRSLDVWIALSDCGSEAPGLDIVGRRLDRVVPTGTHDARLDWTVGRGMVAEVAEGTQVRPEFRAGDGLLLDQLCLHRTGTYPGMVRDRYALEAWFAAPSSYPPKQLPIVY